MQTSGRGQRNILKAQPALGSYINCQMAFPVGKNLLRLQLDASSAHNEAAFRCKTLDQMCSGPMPAVLHLSVSPQHGIATKTDVN